ncbi:MAG: ABC transporter permease [Actinomycetota bacterium]
MTRRFLLTRLGGAILTLFGVAVLVFVVLRLIPGDEITGILGIEAGNLTEAQLKALESYFGLNQPPHEQFFGWLFNVLGGNLGISMRSGASVASLIGDALPVTMELAVLSLALGILLGVPIGVYAATKQGKAPDVAAQSFGLIGLAIPNFVVGTFLITLVAEWFSYFPNAAGYVPPWEDPWLNFQQMIFPAISLGVVLAGSIMRTTRSAFLEVSAEPFVRTARGKGLPPRRVKWVHVFRNATIPIVTITGIQFGYLLGGTVVIEQIFALPGLGRLVFTAINQREFAVVQSTVLVIAAMFVIVNLLVDLLYARIDPRIRLQ